MSTTANPGPLKTLTLTALSAAIAESATFPIDTIKTRLQLTPTDTWRLAGLYRGLPPALLRHVFYTPIRIVLYEHIRAVVGNDGPVAVKALAGGLSGVIAQVVASPADLIKVRMQADSRRGIQPRYAGVFDAVNKIVRNEGLIGLWKGVFPNAQRAFLVNMGELACYDHAKRYVIGRRICEDNVFAHSLASVASGLCATTLSCPADVIKTRMMNQGAGRGGRIAYRNSYECMVRTVKSEGILALWRGFFPTWARLGPWQFVFWVSYERFRHVSGLSSF